MHNAERFSQNIEISDQAKRYINDFELDAEALKDKKILDIGCGDEAQFIEFCLENNIDGIVGVDLRPPVSQELAAKVKGHYVVGQVDNLPFKPEQFDMVLMRSVINPDTELDVNKVVGEAISSLKVNGKLEIYPIWREKPMFEKINNVLKRLNNEEYSIDWQEKDALHAGDQELHKDLLIITRKGIVQ
ncbi:MAG: Methyltransferase domain protein [Parcubacteria group bacterium ADurb.Bin326]|nr:MAG: Methyltransferase domain protein [Parcubacteria group bacterium ADurb.Bin326]